MALYTFYPCKADGTSGTFICVALEDDEEAQMRALQILDQHPDAAYVATWTGDRRVAITNRAHASAEGRPSTPPLW